MESDGKDKLIEKFRERAASLKMPEGVRKVFDEELNKLMHLEPAASEATVTRNYLEWLTQVRTHFPVCFCSRADACYVDSMGTAFARELLDCQRAEGS